MTKIRAIVPTAVKHCLLILIAGLTSLFLFSTSPANAAIDNDRLDGNIFIVYAGNGSLVPPKRTLAESLEKQMPALLIFYLDDSRDCKQFVSVISRLQNYYGKPVSFIPISADTFGLEASYTPKDPGYYYEGIVPQTVILDQQGKVVFNSKGQVKFEAVDDVLREVFNLLPRSESVQLKRRVVNEFNTELVQ